MNVARSGAALGRRLTVAAALLLSFAVFNLPPAGAQSGRQKKDSLAAPAPAKIPSSAPPDLSTKKVNEPVGESDADDVISVNSNLVPLLA